MIQVRHKQEVDLLSIFRFFAMFILLFHHCMQVYTQRIGHCSFFKWQGVSFTWLVNGSSTCGMWILYVLSGYLMGKIFLSGKYEVNRQGVKRFFFNRGLRILPQYWLYLLVLLVMGIFNLSHLQPLKRALTLTYTSGGPIPHLWSISTEFQWYLLVPLCFLLLRRMTVFQAGLGYVVILIIVLGERIWGHFAAVDTYHPLWMNLDFFVCGFLLNVIRSSAFVHRLSQYSVKKLLHYVIGLSLCFYIICSYITFYGSTVRKSVYAPLHDWGLPIVTIFYASAVICLLEGITKAKRYLTDNVWLTRFDFMGGLTFGIYFYHVQVRDFLNRIRGGI